VSDLTPRAWIKTVEVDEPMALAWPQERGFRHAGLLRRVPFVGKRPSRDITPRIREPVIRPSISGSSVWLKCLFACMAGSKHRSDQEGYKELGAR
jgi:hypothetical protein